MNASKILFAGVLSGIVSGLVLDLFGDPTVLWAPGLVFGVVFALAIMTGAPERSQGLRARAAVFAVLSVAAYRIAVFVAQRTIAGSMVPLMADVQEERFWYAGIVAGLAGAGILTAVAWMLRLRRADWANAALVVGIGAAAGALLHFWPLRSGPVHVGSYLLFVPWQCGVGLALLRPQRK